MEALRYSSSSLEDDDELSQDSGYGSPELELEVFSLTPETKSEKSGQKDKVLLVKRSLFSSKRPYDNDDENDASLSGCRKRHCFSYNAANLKQKDKETHAASETTKTVVEKMENDRSLVGDGSRTHRLPTVPGKHKDLHCVSPHTVSQLLTGRYDDVISGFEIIDCRYPYEFDGGHIQDAVNLPTEEKVEDLIKDADRNSASKTILIFHCEFSSERGPTLLRHLRSVDRKLNAENYPFLLYPEVYLMDGGYKAFYETYQDQCRPQSYLPMLHPDHQADLHHFRTSKSQHGRRKKKAVRRRQQADESPCLYRV